MNLETFKEEVDRTIVKRGREYQLAGRVIPRETVENIHHFDVSGSKEYRVMVVLGPNGEIPYSYCNCPYDFGPVCKHETAVYFELAGGVPTGVAEPAAEDPVDSLEAMLSALSKKELVKVILEAAVQDETFESRLLLRYSTSAGTEGLKKWIRTIVDNYSTRGGYIEYGNVAPFAEDLGQCLQSIGETAATLDTLEQAFLILEEAVRSYQYADDSGGSIGMLVQDALGMIDITAQLIVRKEPAQRQTVFDRLLEMSRNRIFDDWEDFRMSLLQMCIPLADTEGRLERLRSVIKSMLKGIDGDPYAGFHQEELTRLLFGLVDEYGSAEESLAFIRGHLHFQSFREQLIEREMTERNFTEVIRLAEEGEQADEKLPGVVKQWRKHRFAAYKALGMLPEQRLLAEELFLRGEFDFYAEMKALTDDPDRLYRELKERLRDGKHEVLFLKLIEEEKDSAELITFVQHNLLYVEQFAEKLYSIYPDELQTAYRSLIESKASHAADRRAYRDVCRMIRRYGKLAGTAESARMAGELKTVYNRKPAFLDELGKL